MHRLAIRLTDYILDKGAIEEESYEIYRFGFQTAMEMGSCIIVSMAIALKMHMLLEYAIFLSIFILVRSYAGGLHLDSFCACFVCSCIVQSGVLLIAKNYELSRHVSFLVILGAIIAIKIIRPVEHINRSLEQSAKKYFQKKLNVILCGIFLIGMLLFGMKMDKYLSLSALTMIVIVTSMIIGKWKQKYDNKKLIST